MIPHRPHGISPPHGTSTLSVSLPLAASLGVSVSLSNESIATGKWKHTLVSPSPLVDNVSKKVWETYQTYHMFVSVSPSPSNKSNLWKSLQMGGFSQVFFMVFVNFPLRRARTVAEGISCEPVAALLAIPFCPFRSPAFLMLLRKPLRGIHQNR